MFLQRKLALTAVTLVLTTAGLGCAVRSSTSMVPHSVSTAQSPVTSDIPPVGSHKRSLMYAGCPIPSMQAMVNNACYNLYQFFPAGELEIWITGAQNAVSVMVRWPGGDTEYFPDCINTYGWLVSLC
jgi:hypothetical protein